MKNKCIVVGVTGGIAAYKIPSLVHKLKNSGDDVNVIMTENAAKFITAYTFQVISENPVRIGMFDFSSDWKIEHISMADKADLIVVAPATANIIGKVANGIADDLLSTTIMATKAPVLFVPSMNVNMFNNSIVQENIKKLKKLGYIFLEPSEGKLACGYEGKGRLPDIDIIFNKIQKILK